MKKTKENLEKWYYDNGRKITFRGKDDVLLRGCSFKKKGRKKAIYVINGRSDNLKQYSEIYYDLFNSTECDVYASDHRGQGCSSRLTFNSYKGHVESYEDYAYDVGVFYRQFIRPQDYDEFYILAHSMGGATTILWLLNDSEIRPTSVFLSAPLFDAIAPIPEWVGYPMSVLASFFGFSESFIPGQGKPNIGPYKSNKLTTDFNRYEIMCYLNRIADATPNLVKPTIGWAKATYEASRRIRKEVKKLVNLDCHIFQAGKEQYIDNDAHRKYSPKTWKIHKFEGQYHQLLHSPDSSRDLILEVIKKKILQN